MGFEATQDAKEEARGEPRQTIYERSDSSSAEPSLSDIKPWDATKLSKVSC